jgi:6-pyruvoyl-tetrahydropterin synthase
MIAHSLPDPAFGPAQNMHGATYVVDAEFSCADLNTQKIVIDIGLAHELLAEVLNGLRYQNLDEHPDFKGQLSTTEWIARYIHQKLADRLNGAFSGNLKVILGESHVAWASYEGKIG